MGSMNKAILIGHLGQDPEIRRTQDGRPIANFSLATSESWRDSAGQKQERTECHRVVVFNEGLAKVCEQYLKKGTQVAVEGKLQTRSWDDQQGVKRYTTEVVIAAFGGSLTMLGTPSGNRPPAPDGPGDYGRPGRSTSGTSLAAAAGYTPTSADMDDEIPF